MMAHRADGKDQPSCSGLPRRADGSLRVVTRILLLCTQVWLPSRVEAAAEALPIARAEETHTNPAALGFAAAPELENRPRSAFENAVMSDLACTCGDCKLELINACRCGFAAKMRGEVLSELDGVDLSTEAARGAAAEAVRASFVARYGAKALERTNRLDPNGRIAAFVVAATVLSFLVVILLRVRSVRRRAREGQ